MRDLFNCWRAFCETLKRAGYMTDDIYEEWYAFFEKYPNFYQ